MAGASFKSGRPKKLVPVLKDSLKKGDDQKSAGTGGMKRSQPNRYAMIARATLSFERRSRRRAGENRRDHPRETILPY